MEADTPDAPAVNELVAESADEFEVVIPYPKQKWALLETELLVLITAVAPLFSEDDRVLVAAAL
jgi:hypothetical protein